MDYYKLEQSVYKEFGESVLIQLGVSRDHAQILMDSLLDADRKGITTHGIYRLNRYIYQLFMGDIAEKPNIIMDNTKSKSIVLIDGGHGLGAVNGYYGMNKAIKLSKESGFGIVSVRNSNHFGAAGYFSEIAAKSEQIGLVFSNSSPSIAPTGGKKPILGNNPWSISVPTRQGYCVTLDIANSKVAKGKIRLAKEKGGEIPFDWALSSQGIPTNDPVEALKGIILPMGDHKGYGITLMIEILAGVLTGADFGLNMVGHDEGGKRNVGHLFLAVNIETLMGINEFYERMDELIGMIKSVPPINEGQEIFIPGEKENLQKGRAQIAVLDKTIESIIDHCKNLSIDIRNTELWKIYQSENKISES